MKILMVHNRYQIRGGEDQSFDSESQLLETNGHQVYRYVRENLDIAKTISKLEAGIRVIWSQSDYAEISQVIADIQPDLLHAQNIFPLISPSIYYAAHQHNIPVVQSLRNYRLWCLNAYFMRNQQPCELCLHQPVALSGIAYKCYRNSYLQSSAVALMQSTHRALGTWQHHVDRYIVLTDFFRQKAIQGGLPSHKLALKPNFVAPDPGMTAQKSNFLLYVGRLSPEKGIQQLLTVWREQPNLPPLKLIGDGPLADQVQALAATTAQVEYLGQRPIAQVYDWMGQAKALLFPSQWYEGLPRTIIEAFAKGTPVIASRLGAMASLIRHQQNGLHFEPGDQADMVRQIRWIDEHPDAWQAMQHQARQDFEAEFTAERNYQILMEIYAAAIAEVSQS